MAIRFLLIISVFTLCLACQEQVLHSVTTAEFEHFIQETNYVTDAEKYDWSIHQVDIINFEILGGLSWRCPDGRTQAQSDLPVCQVSLNDAQAYAEWAGYSIPTYEEYWALVTQDHRPINTSSTGILPANQVNLVGNVWEITAPDEFGRVRLAGGSFLCDKAKCNGTDPLRDLHVDKITGNSHIGFAVIK